MRDSLNSKTKGVPLLYQSPTGQLEFQSDFEQETIWANLNQISNLFGRDKSVISRHIKNIFKSGELAEISVIAKIATTAADGKTYQIDYFNLDMILSIGYRVDSKQATQFRIWATQTLKQHLVDGYTINKSRISHNYDQFMRAVADIKHFLPKDIQINAEDTLELISIFATTWFSLDAYDTQTFPKNGVTQQDVSVTASELETALAYLKQELIDKKQASDLFGTEKNRGALQGILGTVFQTFGGQELYPTIEEKAAHLLYFVVKNHPFNDGNKRCGAFSFVWFLRKAGVLPPRFTPEALTVLTLLVAESNPQDKDKLIGLILLLLQKQS